MTRHAALAREGEYASFLANKRPVVPAVGRAVEPDEVHPALFPFQRDLTRWGVHKGRAALFADAGSEGYVALRNDRRFVGVELNEKYFETAVRNLRQAEEQGVTRRLL